MCWLIYVYTLRNIHKMLLSSYIAAPARQTDRRMYTKGRVKLELIVADIRSGITQYT